MMLSLRVCISSTVCIGKQCCWSEKVETQVLCTPKFLSLHLQRLVYLLKLAAQFLFIGVGSNYCVF